VRLANGVTLVLEIKGHEDDQDRAKHQAAKRWIAAVNHWGQLGRWTFHVCKDPQMLGRELDAICQIANEDPDIALCNQAALEGAQMLDRLEEEDARRQSR
jgi:hypothetical protein